MNQTTANTIMYEKLPQSACDRFLHSVEHLSSIRKHNMAATRNMIANYGTQGAIEKMVRNATNNPGRIKNVKALIADGLEEFSAEGILLKNPQCFPDILRRHATDMLHFCKNSYE